jgi:hypothetical protein
LSRIFESNCCASQREQMVFLEKEKEIFEIFENFENFEEKS